MRKKRYKQLCAILADYDIAKRRGIRQGDYFYNRAKKKTFKAMKSYPHTNFRIWIPTTAQLLDLAKALLPFDILDGGMIMETSIDFDGAIYYHVKLHSDEQDPIAFASKKLRSALLGALLFSLRRLSSGSTKGKTSDGFAKPKNSIDPTTAN